MNVKKEVSNLLYDIVHEYHDKWRETHGYAYNNSIIDLLRNHLSDDVEEWYETHIKKRMIEIPPEYRCKRDEWSFIAFRKFRDELAAKPCEICGFDRAPNIAHIIPIEIAAA